MQPISPEGPKPIPPKNVLPPTPEIAQNLKEPKRFSVTVDGEQRFYPETWPHAYIPDGPLAKLGGGLGSGDIPDKETLIKTLDAITTPSQEVFAAYDAHVDTPELVWFYKIIAPNIVDLGLSMEQFRQPNQKSIGSGWAEVVDLMMEYPYPEGIGEKAARAIGQIEGPTTTRSAFMRYLYHHQPRVFDMMLQSLLKKGTPDSFTLATYVAKDAFQEDLNFDNMVSFGPDGKPKIDQDKIQQAIDTSQQNLRSGFNAPTGYDALVKVLSTKKYQQYQPGHGNLWQGIKPQEEMPAPGISLYEKLADGSFTVDDLGRTVVQAPKVPTDEEAHKQLDQAVKAARYAGVTQGKPIPHSRNIAREVFNHIIKEDYQPYSIRQVIRQLTPEQTTNQERGFFSTRDTNDWYGQTITPAMNLLLATGLYKDVYEFSPSDPRQELQEKGLQKALRGLWLTPLFQAVVDKSLEVATSNKKSTISLGDIFTQLATGFEGLTEPFAEDLATIMAAGYEGFTVAQTLARVAYHQEVPKSTNMNTILQQQDIGPEIVNLLQVAFPIDVLKRAFDTVLARSELPTIENVFGEMYHIYKPLGEDVAESLNPSLPLARTIGEFVLRNIQQQEKEIDSNKK